MHRILARLRGLRETFWVLPALAIALAVVAGLLVPVLDRHVTLPGRLGISDDEDTARSVLTAIVATGVSVAGVSFSIIAVALVLAAQQLSPRVLRSFQRQTLNQAVLALLLGTSTFALFLLASVGEDSERPVPDLGVKLALLVASAALVLFVVFLHHAVRSLNASFVIMRIAAEGHAAIAAPYPAGAGREPESAAAAEAAADERRRSGRCVEVRAPRAGYIASVDGARLVDWATEADALVQQRRAVGEFAVTGAVLALVYVNGAPHLDTGPVASAFELDEERQVHDDVAFPIRQLADIALKGLSPGINDPTTSENAMDSLTDTLVRFANREPISSLRLDGAGVPRLQAMAASLDDLVLLGFDQVRHDSASRPTFAARLLELLADLREAAPAALRCRELDRQARLIAEQAAGLAGHQADQRLVLETHERLHGDAETRSPSAAKP